MSHPRSRVFLYLLAIAMAASAARAAADSPSAFRLYTEQAGVYQVGYDELAALGLQGTPASDSLAVWNQGEPVPVWIEDGGDGVFGPGDFFELVGERLAGKQAYFHPYSKYNVYQLRFDRAAGTGADGFRMHARAAATAAPRRPDAAKPSERTLHFEQDHLLIRLDGRKVAEEGEPDLWFWQKLTYLDREPFAVPVDLPSLARRAGGQVRVRAQFRGLSEQVRRRGAAREPVEGTDHAVALYLGDRLLGTSEWDGKELHTVELPPLDAASVDSGQRLSVRVPTRTLDSASDPIVDIVMVNWLEVSYPFAGLVGEEPVEVRVPAAAPGERVTAESYRPLVAYGNSGSRVPVPVEAGGFEPPAGETRWWLAAAEQRAHVARIEADAPSDLRATGHQADYLVITHPRLRAAIEPLVAYHRASGLKVELVEIQDVYDEFNHGILDPHAIHDFISYAYHSWQPPAPRYVLLVGDASWDTKNEIVDDANYANWSDRGLEDGDRFRPKQGLPPAGSSNDRNLIPTWSYHTWQGHAASDNYFVSVDGDDIYPDLAIGRLPVTQPEDVTAIVDKTLAYMREPEVGPWRRHALWITNESIAYQRRSDRFAKLLGDEGFDSTKVYPRPEEADNSQHQQELLDAFAEGQLLVHFVGHGGRLIWRTGPPDLRKNHDLFTLEHLDQLEPTRRLPVVLSMTCHSGPFDHPSADSIGEKFIRLKGRGAIAVVAASWRNSPAPNLSEALVREMSHPGRIGDAFREAKQGQREMLVELYNLFGDPAVPLAAPGHHVLLEKQADGRVSAVVELAAAGFSGSAGDGEAAGADAAGSFSGHALIEWMDDGEVLREERLELASGRFELTPPADAKPDSVRVYVWNPSTGVDGVGGLSLVPRRAAAGNQRTSE